MRKIFTLDKPNVKLARQMEGAKSEINKYIKRERGKKLPEGVDYWDFSCKLGDTKEEAHTCHLKEVSKLMDELEKREQVSFYVEILAVEGLRKKR